MSFIINENLRPWKVEDLLQVTALYLVGDGIQLTVCSLWKYSNSHSVYTSSSDRYRLMKHEINVTSNQLQDNNTLKWKGQVCLKDMMNKCRISDILQHI